MAADPLRELDDDLDRALAEAEPPARRLADDEPAAPGARVTAAGARALLGDMVRSRALDVAARELRAEGQGHYTIASAGHEANACLGAALRPTDPCLLHYRSGALVMVRTRLHDPDADPVRDTLAGIVGSTRDPASGGRHKVWGSARTWVWPQTSTIASHVPKAAGLAFALGRARRLGAGARAPADALVCASVGDASLHHAAALAGVNAARYAHRRGNPVPLLLVCEDNGLGISVDTPPRWVEETAAGWRGLRRVRAAGELDEVLAAAESAVATCRRARAPVLLHLPVVRLGGHAGSDVEGVYRDPQAIRADRERDPIAAAARRLLRLGAATPDELGALVSAVRAEVAEAADEARGWPRLSSAEEATAPLAPGTPEVWAEHAARVTPTPAARRAAFGVAEAGDGAARRGRTLPEHATAPARRTLAGQLNAALGDLLVACPEALVFGEDVGAKGGLYGVTAGLQRAFGAARVFDTHLDETSILGLAQGAGVLGLLPIAEIPYLAYLHNAIDQLRGEAASTQWLSNGQYATPMVVRVASFAGREGAGGPFHNDHAVGALRDIPGLIVAAPSRGDDAARMLRGLAAAARASGRVTCLLEPTALYHARDLHEAGDGAWLADYPPPPTALLPGEVGVHHPEAGELAIVAYAGGVPTALRAAAALAGDGVAARVVDLRWLAPLPHAAVVAHAAECGAVLVLDECRAAGGVADAVVAGLVEDGWRGPVATVRAADCYVPIGPAAACVLPGVDEVAEAGARLARERLK